VPTNPTRNTLHEYARLGAIRRLEEIRQEEARIRAAFPELFRGQPARGRAVASATSSAAANDAPPRRRPSRMSAAQRKAVSERMKKYWAARRKAKNG
jgi:hypothetical protein